MEATTQGPIAKQRVGRFQISIFKREKLVPARDDYDVERRFDIVRACVQYSRFNKRSGAYDRQQIWCDPHELRNLVQVLDEMNSGGVHDV